jgi:DNA uptake protein ComE-like DNA-binding protein
VAEERDRLNVNTATERELVELGILPRVAARIVTWREEHGSIRNESELYQVVRDNEIRLDQLLSLVHIDGETRPRLGYST